MRKLLSAAVVITLFLVALPALSNPPDRVDLSWDPAAQALTVKAAHYTLSPKHHYIKSFRVVVDGKEAMVKTFTSQASKQEQVESIPLPGLKPGAVIVVTASCSLYGSGEGKVTLPR